MKYRLFFRIFLIGVIISSISAWAQSPAELAAETETYCASTASTPATPELIMQKVNKAAKLLETEGRAALPKFMGKGSEFVFAGTYMWIHDMNGHMLMHPIKYKMAGRNMSGLKDKNGKRFIVLINKIAQEKGDGWISYLWPKPGAKQVSPKVSYFKKVRSADGIEMVVCCGVYDMNKELVQRGYDVM